MTNRAEAEKLAMARRIAAHALCGPEKWKPGVKAGMYQDIIDGLADNEAIVLGPLAAIEEHQRLIVDWLRELSTRLVTPDFLAFVGDPFGRDGQQLCGELADMIEAADHLKGTPNER